MEIFNILFPNYQNKKWKEINLNKESKNYSKSLLDQLSFEKFVTSLSKNYKCDFTWGGFLENRSFMLRDTYNTDKKLFVHLGIDINVPTGTKVCSPCDGEVFHVFRDKDQNGGWGGRIIIKVKKRYFILGHLKKSFKWKVGQKIIKGQTIGEIAFTTENGGWWPHLHLQLVNQKFIKKYKNNLNIIDGYAGKNSPEIKWVHNPLI